MSEKKSYDSRVAAKFLLALANRKGLVFNTTKVQKILYIIYSYYIAKEGRRILDEQPKAWPFGPVFPKTRKINYSIVYNPDDEMFSEIKSEPGLEDIINSIIDVYGHYTASQLTEWSHKKDSPWDKTTKKFGFNWNDPIDDVLIVDYFSEYEMP
jgi:uncharacterized phage-associated protein